jgi:hypothetical protein
MGDPSSTTREEMSTTERAVCNVNADHAHH